MAFTKDEQESIALVAEERFAKRIDEQVARQLRWVQVLAAFIGFASVGGLVAAFLILPDLAASKLLGQITGLNTDIGQIIVQAENAKSAATNASKAAEDATRAATSAKAAASNVAAVDVEKTADQLARIRKVLDQNKEAAKLVNSAISQFTAWQEYAPATPRYWTPKSCAGQWRQFAGDVELVAAVVLADNGNTSNGEDQHFWIGVPENVRKSLDQSRQPERVGSATIYVKSDAITCMVDLYPDGKLLFAPSQTTKSDFIHHGGHVSQRDFDDTRLSKLGPDAEHVARIQVRALIPVPQRPTTQPTIGGNKLAGN